MIDDDDDDDIYVRSSAVPFFVNAFKSFCIYRI
jgi:hypothetical protein